MEAQQNTHWDSKEFADLIEHAFATDDNAEHKKLLKQAYLFAKREAPWAKTAGKAGFKIKVDAQFKPGKILLSQIDIEDLHHFLKEKGLLAVEEENHWDSPEFDDLISDAMATNDELERSRILKKAYLFAKDNAPLGTITVGKRRYQPVRGDVSCIYAPMILEVMRHSLKEKGALAAEDSSE